MTGLGGMDDLIQERLEAALADAVKMDQRIIELRWRRVPYQDDPEIEVIAIATEGDSKTNIPCRQPYFRESLFAKPSLVLVPGPPRISLESFYSDPYYWGAGWRQVVTPEGRSALLAWLDEYPWIVREKCNYWKRKLEGL